MHEALDAPHPSGVRRSVSPAGPEVPSGEPARVLRFEAAVVDQDPHRPLFLQALAGDPAVDEDIALHDPDRFPRQPDHALHISLRRLAGEMEDGDLPALGPSEFVEELLHEHPIPAAFEGRHPIHVPLPAVRADRRPRVPFLIDPYKEHEPAVGTHQLAMPAQQRRCHRSGRHHVGFGRERPRQDHAQTEEYQQFDRLAHQPRSRPGEPAVAAIGGRGRAHDGLVLYQ